jgi:hypothetical protein
LNPRRVCTHRRPSVRAVSTISNAALDSGNGAALAPEKPDHAAPYYGRQFFPLAAVVGQVQTLFLSLKIFFFCFVSFVFVHELAMGFSSLVFLWLN